MHLWIPKPLISKPYSTLLYTTETSGREVLLGARIASDGQWRFPSGSEVPEKFAVCLTQYEDKRFWYHPGIDPFALMRAVHLNLTQSRVVSGGSTLTMQLARIARGNQSRTVGQKVIEMLWALYLECSYSKAEILRMYASNAPFGGNVVGIEAAAWRYFGREAKDLSWAEQATLAVLPNSPALIHPGRNRAELKQKRDKLLLRLYEKHILDKTEYELACMEALPEKPLPLPNEAPHLLERLAIEKQENRIQTTVDPTLQQQVQRLVNRYVADYRSNHIYNAAALVADVESGKILAYVGNVTDQNMTTGHGYQVDVITSPRSTGSVLKPFLYAAMLNDGLILPGTLIADTPLNINGFTPQNFNKTFYGAVPAHVAIERSLNVPLVRMLSQYNTGRFMSLLKRLGMTTLRFSEDHYGASLILGGAEGSLWDLSGIYASLARMLSHYRSYNGRYDRSDIHPLTPYPVEEKKPIHSVTDTRLADESLLSYASLWFMFEAMSGLNRPEEEADWQQFSSMKQVAWKTGTSYGGRDAWAIGVTPRYVVGVWVGNATGEGRSGLTGVGYAAPILFDIYSLLPDVPWFDQPYDELEEVAVCRQSGHKASAICDEVDTVYIPRTGIATAVCPYHRIVHLSQDGQYRVNSSCESVSRMQERSWFVLPPAQAYYYKNYHVEYQALPPLKPGCEEDQSRQIAILYPEHQAVLYLPKGFSGEREKVVLRATHARSDATLYWHLDDVYLGETRQIHQMACLVEPGNHILTLLDEDGNRRSILFEVRK
ncbi:MAG: penicillin-binding protein 1C [Parabacteroides sp.]|nr:penicillin-binding protein 1C [Parabacteroides sp.]